MLHVPGALDDVAEFVSHSGLDRRLKDVIARFRGPSQEYSA